MKIWKLAFCYLSTSHVFGLVVPDAFDGFQNVERLNYAEKENDIWMENEKLIQLHKDLVEIPSISYEESDLVDYLQEYFTSKGFSVEKIMMDEKSKRANLYVYHGEKRDTKIMMMSHIDTVPPFLPYKIIGNKIYGRGTADDKASVASQIIAFEELLKLKEIKEGDVAILIDVGEEKDADGAFSAGQMGIPWETVIFGEPTYLKLVIAHKGIANGVLKATGKTAHSSVPELGINAIELLLDALQDLRHAEFPGNEILGASTLNIGMIEGGVAANVIPDEARATILLRVACVDAIEVDKVFEDVLKRHPKVEWENYVSMSPVFFKHDIPGYNTSIMPFGTDALIFKGDFEKYLIGPGGDGIHSAEEHISVEELVRGVAVYKEIISYKLKQGNN